MSGFIGPTTGNMQSLLFPGDYRIFPGFMVDQDPFTIVMIDEPFLFFQYETLYWPRSDFTGITGIAAQILGGTWRDKTELIEAKGGGTNSRLAISGICLDANNVPVSGAVVKLFKTADTPIAGKDVLFDETTSDANGNWLVYTPYYPDTHYIVEYKVGSDVPDTFGTSVNTLTGA